MKNVLNVLLMIKNVILINVIKMHKNKCVCHIYYINVN